MGIFLIWTALTILAVFMAGNRNRSRFGWFIFSFFFTPVIAVLFLSALGGRKCHSCGLNTVKGQCEHCGSGELNVGMQKMDFVEAPVFETRTASSVIKVILCVECDHESAADSRFCGGCGKGLGRRSRSVA